MIGQWGRGGRSGRIGECSLQCVFGGVTNEHVFRGDGFHVVSYYNDICMASIMSNIFPDSVLKIG